MFDDDKNSVSIARDEFERYYTEKIWEWIPAFYKDEDGLAAKPDVLRTLVEILAHQAASARRSIDRLWADQFIAICDDWAIPYIGDLVGTRLVHELNRRGRRVDVARTVFYRRRKGTPRVLEILIRDITGWQGVVVESFKRLTRARHGLDPEPVELEGFVTRTPPGGWAKLTSVRGAELVDGPFNEMAHTPDFRQLRGKLGRYNIPKLNFHLFRLVPFEVNFVTPVDFAAGRFTFDPSGRDAALFRPDQRPDPKDWRPAAEWEVPAAIPCRLLGAAHYALSAQAIDKVTAGLPQAAADEVSRYAGVLFHSEARLRETIESLAGSAAILPRFGLLLAESITMDSPKAHLIPTAIQPDPSAVAISTGPDKSRPPIEHQVIAAGNLQDWGASLALLPPEKTCVIDPERGRFWFREPPSENVWVPVYHYGFSGGIGAGTYDRRDTVVANGVVLIDDGGAGEPGPVSMNVPSPPLSGVFEFGDSKTYLPNADVIGISKLAYQAANFRRPYVRRVLPAGAEWIFEAEPKQVVSAGEPEPETNRRELTLDGLWIGLERESAAPAPAPCAPAAGALVLQGVFDRVLVRHCTLDPGGEKARIDPGSCQVIPYVQLVVRGNIEELIIESSILGPVMEDTAAADPGIVQKLVMRDSIVHSIDPANSPAIATALGFVELERVTVFGNVRVNRLSATEALIQGTVKVTDNQHGCFRFSATDDQPEKRLPPQFESLLFAPAIPNHFFVSRRFGDPGYAQLSDTASEKVVRGAENRSEIGAFSSLLGPIKLDDLKAKVNEFMPFGLIAQFINET